MTRVTGKSNLTRLNQFFLSNLRRQQELRAYCPKTYTVGGGVKSAFLNVRISTTYCDIFLFKLPIMECVSLGVCSKVYMENYK